MPGLEVSGSTRWLTPGKCFAVKWIDCEFKGIIEFPELGIHINLATVWIYEIDRMDAEGELLRYPNMLALDDWHKDWWYR